MKIYNKLTLAFPKKEEKQFLNKYFTDSIGQTRVGIFFAAMLYGAFGYLDNLVVPEFAKLFHIIRFYIVIPGALLVLLLLFIPYFQKIWQSLVILLVVAGGVGISIMTMLAPDNYSYYAGLMLIFSAGYFLFKLRFLNATIAGWIILLLFNVLAIFFAHSDSTLIISYNFFFVSANLIGMVAAYSIEYYTRRNFLLNHELDQEKIRIESINSNLEKTIEERTFELQNAKQKAEESELRYKELANLLPIVVYEVNVMGQFIFANNQAFKSFGYTEDIYINEFSIVQMIVPEDRERATKAIRNILATKSTSKMEYTALRKDGSTFAALVYSSAIIKDNQPIGMRGVLFDISEIKKTENDLIVAKEKAEDSDRLKSAFLANMSHEIRTPMNGILGFASLLKNPQLEGEKQQKYIEIIEKSGVRMLKIINDIIDISKIEAGLMKVDKSESNINEQINYIYTFFKPEVEAKGMKLSFKNALPNKSSLIYTDREKVFAILTNLIKNAIKYSVEGSIDFGYTLKRDNEQSLLEFFVKDTGIGIPEDKLEAIFERFVQADTNNRMAQQGNGLGLAITKAYVEMLGGKIWVESKVGLGSCFYFTLSYPIESLSANQTNRPFGIADETASEYNPVVSGLKMLIVEDDETSETLLTIIFEKYTPYIVKAYNGIEAVEICRNKPELELILMDLQMPQMDGYEATRQIRLFNKDVIIIAQTAFGLTGDREKALEAGCTDYISKPISEVGLLELIQKHLKK